jgi:hypothetical protein
VGQFTVDTKGRITAASQTAISASAIGAMIAPLKFSRNLNILSLNGGFTTSLTITGSGLLKTYPVLVAINQTSNIPDYLLLTAYCSSSTTISVSIRNSSSSTISFDASATIEATVFR